MKRFTLSAATIYAFRIDNTAHLINGYHIFKCFFQTFQFGSNFDFCLPMICDIRIVTGISRFFYQLFGTRIHGYKDIVCIRFGRMLFHTVCICRIGTGCSMFSHTHVCICTFSSFRSFFIMLFIRIHVYRSGRFANNQIYSLMQ